MHIKKIKNIICVEIYKKGTVMHLKLNPNHFELEDRFTRDVRGIGHLGTGDLQVWIRSKEEFEKAKPYLQKVYQMN